MVRNDRPLCMEIIKRIAFMTKHRVHMTKHRVYFKGVSLVRRQNNLISVCYWTIFHKVSVDLYSVNVANICVCF